MTPVYHELLKRVWRQADQEGREPAEDVAEFMRDLKSRQLILDAGEGWSQVCSARRVAQ